MARLIPRFDGLKLTAFQIAVIYAVAGMVWIVATDTLVAWLLPTFAGFVGIGMAKGLVFVISTSTVLYLLLAWRDRRWAKAEARVGLVVNQLPGLLWTTDRDLTIESVLGSIDGLPLHPDALVGRKAMEAATTPARQAVIESNHRRALRGEAGDYSLEFDGREFATRVEPLRGEGGDIVGTVGFALEVTPVWNDGREGGVRGAVRRSQLLSGLGNLVLDVAHKIKNPLFALSAALDALEQRTGDQPDTVRHRAVLRQQVVRIEDLVSGLQVYGRISDLDFQEVDLVFVVRRTVRELESMAATAGVSIDLQLSPEALPVDADPDALSGALRRVITNAVQYSPPGTAVTVTAGKVGDAAEISVSDLGSGFEPGDLERVFEPLFGRRPDGAGLGLAIAERIVQRHGGWIGAENLAAGGARVSVRLPL